jgi:hypothetical protein
MTRGREELRMGFQEEVEAFAGGFLGRSDNARQLCEELANCTDICRPRPVSIWAWSPDLPMAGAPRR